MDKHSTVLPEELATNLRQLIAGSEELMNSIRKEGGSRYEQAMKRIGRDIERTREQLDDAQYNLARKARTVRRKVDGMVNEHPWETAGTAAAVGALLGVAIGLLIARSVFRRDL